MVPVTNILSLGLWQHIQWQGPTGKWKCNMQLQGEIMQDQSDRSGESEAILADEITRRL